MDMGMWALNSLTGDQMSTPELEGEVLTTGPPESPAHFLLLSVWSNILPILYTGLFVLL